MTKNKLIEYKLNFIKFLQHFTKKDTFILFDNLYEKNAESIDTYCIFEQMQKQNIKSYYVLYKENELYKKLKKENRLKNVIVLNKSMYDNHQNNFEIFDKIFTKLPRTKAVITSFGSLNYSLSDFLKSNKFIKYICTTHGSIFLKTFPLIIDFMSAKIYDKLIAANNLEKDIDIKYGGYEPKDAPVIGLPRWNKLTKIPHEQKTIFMMFTWRTSFSTLHINEYGIALRASKYYTRIQDFINDTRLNEILNKHNVKLIYTLHHSMLNQVDNAELSKFSNIEYVPSEHISQYIKTSDLFITDYSSLFFDFAYLNTPIVFYRPDFDDTSLIKMDRDDMVHAKTMDKYLANICYDKTSAIDTIEKYIENNFVLETPVQEKYEKLFTDKENIMTNFINYVDNLNSTYSKLIPVAAEIKCLLSCWIDI